MIFSHIFQGELIRQTAKEGTAKSLLRNLNLWSATVNVLEGGVEIVDASLSYQSPDEATIKAGTKIAKGFLKSSKALADGVEKVKPKENSKKTKTVELIKKELTDDFRKLTEPSLVIVDDIDRLAATEIRLLFQLIKANSDFPNLVFMVLCQRDMVEQSLAELMPTSVKNSADVGRSFLSKIVDVGLMLPAPDWNQLHSLMKTAIEECFGMEAIKDKDLQFLSGITLRIGDIRCARQINRLRNCITFQKLLLTEKNILQIHPVDIVFLEAIRLFEPVMFSSMRYNVKFYTDPTFESFTDNPYPNVAKEKVDVIKIAIWELFPMRTMARAKSEHEKKERTPHLSKRENGVERPELFAIYFDTLLRG